MVQFYHMQNHFTSNRFSLYTHICVLLVNSILLIAQYHHNNCPKELYRDKTGSRQTGCTIQHPLSSDPPSGRGKTQKTQPWEKEKPQEEPEKEESSPRMDRLFNRCCLNSYITFNSLYIQMNENEKFI